MEEIEKTRVIIGLTSSSSGSSTVADILAKEGFYKYPIAQEILEKEAQNAGLGDTKDTSARRAMLQNIGNQLRREKGHGFLVERALQDIAKKRIDNPIVIDSIKNTAEVAKLREYANAYIIAIDASLDTRWNRVKDNYRGNAVQFEADDKRDKDEGLEWGQQVQQCVDMADILLINEENFEGIPRKEAVFKNKMLAYARLLSDPSYKRLPTPRELVMNNAYCTSLMSNCLRRRVGAIIVSQETTDSPYDVIATGYNRPPRGQNDCVEDFEKCYRIHLKHDVLSLIKYCPACGADFLGDERRCSNSHCPYSNPAKDLVGDYSYGKGLDVCRAVHAEETAILQTCRQGGPSLQGTILFTTTFPCPLCAKQIIESGIREVVYVEAYPTREAIEALRGAEIELTKYEGVKAQAFYKLFGAS